tara:strand:+ start:273 stop:722 length:450 start_codon:yes stop_codon:yes gene_type:complete
MKKIIIIICFSLALFSNIYAAICTSDVFTEIRGQAKLMEKAWDQADAQKTVSFYADDFMYFSAGKPYTTKSSVLKHYVDDFASYNIEKADWGSLKLNYEYCKNIDKNHQLVILQFVLHGSDGKMTKGHDLLIWEKDAKGAYKIMVDFPQ